MDKITIERSIWINALRERVWQAVSDPVQIAQWFAPGAVFSINNNRITVRIGETDMEVAVIETIDPPRQLTTRNLPEMNLATTYLLEEENGGTRFTVIESGLETLSEDERQKHLEQDSSGWEMALENLKAFVDGKSLPHPQGFKLKVQSEKYKVWKKEQNMQIKMNSIFVDDQDKALKFYTDVLGFVKKSDVPVGEFKWLTVVSAEGPDDIELLLEPNDNPAAKAFQESIYQQGIPARQFAAESVQSEYERLKKLGVKFTMEPTVMGPVTIAVFDDTCGNLIQIAGM